MKLFDSIAKIFKPKPIVLKCQLRNDSDCDGEVDYQHIKNGTYILCRKHFMLVWGQKK